jgi:hypothetical protein
MRQIKISKINTVISNGPWFHHPGIRAPGNRGAAEETGRARLAPYPSRSRAHR